MKPTTPTLLIPTGQRFLIALDAYGNAHAVPYTIKNGPFPIAACGVEVTVAAWETSAPGKHLALVWPPRRDLWRSREGRERCETCYVISGEPPPDPSYDRLVGGSP